MIFFRKREKEAEELSLAEQVKRNTEDFWRQTVEKVVSKRIFDPMNDKLYDDSNMRIIGKRLKAKCVPVSEMGAQ